MMRRRMQWNGILLGVLFSSGTVFILTSYFIPKDNAVDIELDDAVFLNDTGDYVLSSDIVSDKCTETCTQEQRFKLLQEQCKKYPELQNTYDPDDKQTFFRLFVDDKHKVLYCALPKAASTMFYNVFYYSITGKQLGKKEIHCRSCWEKEGLVYLNRFSKEERDRRLRDYYKVMVVRNPMDRMVSCWNGKFTSPREHATWRQNGPRMIEMFREIQKNSTLEYEITKGATFPEFIQYVNYLERKEQDKHNQHWNAHYRLCHPCSIDYDLILKVETLHDDQHLFLPKLGLNTTSFPLINARRTEEEENITEKIVEEYRDINPKQMSSLRKMFRYDMDLFGYQWDPQRLSAKCATPCHQNPQRTCC